MLAELPGRSQFLQDRSQRQSSLPEKPSRSGLVSRACPAPAPQPAHLWRTAARGRRPSSVALSPPCPFPRPGSPGLAEKAEVGRPRLGFGLRAARGRGSGGLRAGRWASGPPRLGARCLSSPDSLAERSRVVGWNRRPRGRERAVDNLVTMSLLNCEDSCVSSQSESDCCAAMASSCSAAAKDDSGSGTTSTGTLSSSFMEEIQGYDVEFDPPLESKYECPICLMALREAVQTPCGHRFCKACIIKSIRDAGHKCPVDNEILLETQLFPDNFAKREILSLMVKCPNKGCLHKMELRHLEDHQAHCEFALVNCPQCQRPFQKCHLNIHILKECPRRQVSCINCAMSMAFEDKEVHDQSCPLANVICEYCNTILIREQMPNHFDLDCPTAPIPCTFSTFGCHEKMQRIHLARHLQENTQSHMRMLAQAVQSLNLAVAPRPQRDMLPYDSSSLPRISSGCHAEVQNFQETIQQLESRLVRQDHQIRELTAKMETQSMYVGDLKRTIRTLEDKVAEIEAQQCNGIYIWKIGNFGMHLKSQEEEKPVVIHSPGFYTGKPGYKLCMRLHLQLPTAQRCANYISLFVHTMQGEYDSHLPWPFQGTIRLTILDQSEAAVRQNHEEIMDAKPELLAFQRPTIPRNPKGFGYVTFMHLEALRQRTFIKDDTLLVRCEVTTRFDMGSLRREGFQPRSTDAGV